MKYFKKNMKDEHRQALIGIYDRINEICQKNMLHWAQETKKNGFETIDAQRMHFSINHIPDVTKDTKMYIFRFNAKSGKDGRIICYQQNRCPILYVVGFDFDFSAYDHGA